MTLRVQPKLRSAAYPPYFHQPVHYDAGPRISLVLKGAVAEETNHFATIVEPGDIIIKSASVAHEDRFGPQGAALASAVLADDADFSLDGVWRIERSGKSLGLCLTMLEALEADDADTASTAAACLFVRTDQPDSPAHPPRWLVALKEELETVSLAAVNVANRAKAAGVHPVTASRLFKAAFGVSITEHAQFHGIRRALVELASPETSMAAIANDAGFYDQSHMNRTFRRLTGGTPGAYRALAQRAISAAC